MTINSYRFGEMVVDGRRYTRDLVIRDGAVLPDWWRREGHRLALEDLKKHLSKKYEVIIVGTGASGMMEVPEEVERYLMSKTSRLVIERTAEASREYNESGGRRVLAAFHLTC